VIAKNGRSVDASHHKPESLSEAASIGKSYQTQGCAVTITDKRESPYRLYTLSKSGKPILI
jgi:hypothetical protein